MESVRLLDTLLGTPTVSNEFGCPTLRTRATEFIILVAVCMFLRACFILFFCDMSRNIRHELKNGRELYA